uniref:biogenesis of lysosome-related organelles complex 1 subunit 2-like n=1 Tax=Ciona intestinalis TaxID=7719 RepID=UPI000180CB28|nr:biogenesis of lysosome-related organelles complex 1 subunit 2-like [Ciona intestinalis]|eukprot:XP_026692711.1 biogenesis of lysosome-related organelles complex 1 subunit 2-like [Ciona intestinalis]
MDQAIEATEELPTSAENTSHTDKNETNRESNVELPQHASDEENDHLQLLCSEMFQKMSLYLNGEVENTIQDYILLENMNKATTVRYDEMHHTARTVGDSLHEINQKFSDLQPYLEQIENIEQSILTLEQAAYKLDAYSKRLEERFKRAQKLAQ